MKDMFEFPGVPAKIKSIQIICVALIMGVLMFLAVTFVVANNEKGWHTDLMVLVMATLASCYLVSFVVPTILLNAAKSRIANCKTDEEAVNESLAAFQTATIVGYALIEGAVFANLVAFMLTGSLISVAVAGVGIVLMIARFPFPGRIAYVVEELTAAKN